MIELTVHGDPAQCRSAADALNRQRRQVSAAEAELSYALRVTGGSWRGAAADRFRLFATGVRDEAADLDLKTSTMMQELEHFADALDAVRAQMDQARHEALGAGLVVDGDVIHPPTSAAEPGPEAVGPVSASAAGPAAFPDTPSAPVAEADPRGPAYQSCRQRVEAARGREQRAHEALQEVAADVVRAPFLEHWLGKAGIIPTSTSAAGLGLWGGNAALFGVGTAASWATKAHYGGFRPLVNNTRVLPKDIGWWQRGGHAFLKRSWGPNTGQSVPHARWARTGKIAGRAGVVLAAGTSAWGQWQADADNLDLSTTDRVGRAATVGVATGAGAYAGAVGGAQLGGAIGTAIAPGVGTVVGGAIGGTVGGVIGSGAGEAVGGLVVEYGTDARDAAIDFAGDAGSVLQARGGDLLGHVGYKSHAVLDGATDVAGGAMSTGKDVLDSINPF